MSCNFYTAPATKAAEAAAEAAAAAAEAATAAVHLSSSQIGCQACLKYSAPARWRALAAGPIFWHQHEYMTE